MEKKKSFIKLLLGGFILLLILGAGVAAIYLQQSHSVVVETARRTTQFDSGPVVRVAIAAYKTAGKQITLIGEARPYASATVYAKISGYLQRISVDKGDKVNENQEIAYVDNPEIDQQYNAAVADLENKKKILERDKTLLAKKFISQEDEDLSETSVRMAEATVKSLGEQQRYKSLRAPFAGTITARYVDPGALIQNANNAQTSSQPVVTIATLQRLRVYVYVEQKDAANLQVGNPVEITLTERPDVLVKAKISRITGELDPRTRMMLAEVDVDNDKGEIVPGSYVQVHISKPPDEKNKKVVIPASALIIHVNKPMVAEVDSNDRLHFVPIQVSSNNGDMVSISSGLDAGQRVAIQVGERFLEGQKVRIEK